MAIRAIIFDLDDTLIADEEISMVAFEAVGRKAAALGADAKNFVVDCKHLVHALWHAGPCYAYCDAIGISATECLWGTFDDELQELRTLRNWALTFRESVFSHAIRRQLEHVVPTAGAEFSEEFGRVRRKFQRLMPNAKEVLGHLHSHYCLGMLTNGAPSLQREKIVAAGIDGFFKSIAISGERRIGKPQAAVFFQLIKELDMSPSEVIMVGNSKERDIVGAYNAGVRSIWLRSAGVKDCLTVHPNAEVSTLSKIPLLIEEMNAGSQ